MSIAKQPLQLPLTITNSAPRVARPNREVRSVPERLNGIDQVLNTLDVERITGRHRCTVYRWVVAGTFPAKRAGGGRGWLRSDVERWLRGDAATAKKSTHSPESAQASVNSRSEAPYYLPSIARLLTDI
jgi:predicted DNA-binding transcriptional regulator AlpA